MTTKKSWTDIIAEGISSLFSVLILAWPVQLAWNEVISITLGLPLITWTQALLLQVLFNILFKAKG